MASVLQIPSKQNGSLGAAFLASGRAASTTVTVPKVLTIDTLTVNSIILLDSLYTKTDIDVAATNKLQISKGSIVNSIVSQNPAKKAITFNNVYFQPDPVIPDAVSIYGKSDLNIGTLTNNLGLYGSNISISSNIISFMNPSDSSNSGQIQYDPTTNKIKFLNDVLLTGNLEVKNAVIYETIIINQSNIYISEIFGNLTVDGELFAKGNLFITNDLKCNNLNVTSISVSTINGNLTIGDNLTVNSSIYTPNILLNNQILTTNSANDLIYNSNIILTINSSNIINMSNIIIYDATNSQEVLLEVRGNIQCNAVFLTSNMSKKKNIREITVDEINRVNGINSYNYNLKSNDTNNFGFLAHEVQSVYPMLSDGDSVNYIGFIPLLLEKIKIMEDKINELEKKIMI